MARSAALTSDEQTRLAGMDVITGRFLSTLPGTAFATARLNLSSFNYPTTQLPVDTTSADWLNVREGMSVWIGSAAGLHDRGIYRAKQAPGASTLYIGETSEGDPGLLATDLRSLGFQDNDHVTVIDRRDLTTILPRIDPATGAVYENYDETVGAFTTTSKPVVNITINGVGTFFWATYLESGTVALTCVATVSHWPTTSGAAYAWTTPSSGWASVSGATSATLTATVSPGNYVLRLTVTPTVGMAMTREVYINVHDPVSNPPIQLSEPPSGDVRDRQGRKMTLSLIDTRVASIPDGAAVCYFEMGTWAGLDVPSATRHFPGWLVRRVKTSGPDARGAEVDIVGPAGLMATLNNTSDYVEASASPTTWQQAVPSLMTWQFMAWKLLHQRFRNFVLLCNVTFQSMTAAGHRLPAWKIPGGTILSQLQSLMTERGNVGCNSAGELFLLHHPNMVEYDSARAGIPLRDTLDSSKVSEVEIPEDLPPETQQVRGEALSWDGSAGEASDWYADAPEAPGQGGAPIKLPSQVVDGIETLKQLTADYLYHKNNPRKRITVRIGRNRDVYEPAEMYFVGLNQAQGEQADNVAFTKRTIPVSVSKQHNRDLTAALTLITEGETHGTGAVRIIPDEPVDNAWGTPYLPDPTFDLPPLGFDDTTLTIPEITAPGQPGIPTNGDFKVYCSNDGGPNVYRTFDRGATWEEVPIPAFYTEVLMVTIDRSVKTSRAVYLLGNDGTDTKVAHLSDIGATAIAAGDWDLGVAAAGIYDQMESFRDNAGTTETYCPDTTTGSTPTVTVTYDSGGYGSYTIVAGTETTGGNPGDCNDGGSGAATNAVTRVDLGAEYTVTLVDFDYYKYHAAPYNLLRYVALKDAGLVTLSEPINSYDTGAAGWKSLDTGAISQAGVRYIDVQVGASGAPVTLNARLDNIAITYISTPGTKSVAALSTDYGATLEPVDVVGDSLAAGGFSAAYRGPVSVGASLNQVKKASAFGGSYASESLAAASARNILVTWYKEDGLPNSGASPMYLFATSSLWNSGALFLILSTGSRIDITPSVTGTKALAVSARGLGAWRHKHFMYLGSISGTTYIHVTRDRGQSWIYQVAKAGAVSICPKRYSATGNEWDMARGANGIDDTRDGGATWNNISTPTDPIYVESFG